MALHFFKHILFNTVTKFYRGHNSISDKNKKNSDEVNDKLVTNRIQILQILNKHCVVIVCGLSLGKGIVEYNDNRQNVGRIMSTPLYGLQLTLPQTPCGPRSDIHLLLVYYCLVGSVA